MVFVVDASPVPLRVDGDGVVRVGQTRVPLDTIVILFDRGASPEEIVQQFPALDLAAVYAAIGYYLRHREEVAAHLAERQERAATVRREIEARHDQRGIRDRLLARKAARGSPSGAAPIGGLRHPAPSPTMPPRVAAGRRAVQRGRVRLWAAT